MAFLVYQLTCSETGKSYVGITSRALDTRWFEHCQRARQGDRESRLYDAMRKYGLDCWKRIVIHTADTEDEARLLERRYIEALDTFEYGYNANKGGCGWLVIPDDVRRKMSEAQKGKIISPECRAKMSAAKKGQRHHAEKLGAHTKKGAGNPRSRSLLVRFPNGEEHVVTGVRAFHRETGIVLWQLEEGESERGYKLIRKYPLADAASVSNNSTE